MEPNTATTIKDSILALGERLSEYHQLRSWTENGNQHPRSQEDLKQAVDGQEEVVFFHFEQSQDHDLWKFFKAKGRLDFFRLRLISLLASKVVSGTNLCPPVIDILKTTRSLGDEDLDTALGKIVAMVKEGHLVLSGEYPPYLIAS